MASNIGPAPQGPIPLSLARQLFHQQPISGPTFPDYHMCDRSYGENLYVQGCQGLAINLILRSWDFQSIDNFPITVSNCKCLCTDVLYDAYARGALRITISSRVRYRN